MSASLIHRRAFLRPPAPETPILKRCDRFADAPLTNQFGERLRFREAFLKDRAVVINTMFTVCRGTCPGTSAVIQSLRRKLFPIFGDKLSFVSITLDPAVDTPEVLREYARLYKADQRLPGHCDWQFATGRPEDIDKLRRSLGFYDLDPKIDSDITRHGALLLFGNSRTDRWAALPSGSREPLLIEAIRRVAGFSFEQKYGIAST